MSAIEDVLFNRDPDATERLIELAEATRGVSTETRSENLEWREGEVEERLKYALLRGETRFIDEDTEEARLKFERPLDVMRVEGIELPCGQTIRVVTEALSGAEVYAPAIENFPSGQFTQSISSS